jgi:hypothetical protein
MKFYCGIDLHAKNSCRAIIDEQRKRVFKRNVTNDRKLILALLDPTGQNSKGWSLNRRSTRTGSSTPVRHESTALYIELCVPVPDRRKRRPVRRKRSDRRGPQSSFGFQRMGVISRAVLNVPERGHHRAAGLPQGVW